MQAFFNSIVKPVKTHLSNIYIEKQKYISQQNFGGILHGRSPFNKVFH